MVRITDFNRPKRTYDKEDSVKRPLPSQQSAYQSQRATPNPRSEARRLKRKAIREADKECFVCRQKGHLSQDCPKASQNGAIANKTNICYRCGAIDHTLKQCKKTPMRKRKRAAEEESESEVIEQEFLPFASCYICQQTGHLVESCPENVRGIYPNGGGCKLCGATDHLKSKCPQKEAIEQGAVVARKANETAGADEDAYHEKLRFEESQRRAKLAEVKLAANKKRPKIVKF